MNMEVTEKEAKLIVYKRNMYTNRQATMILGWFFVGIGLSMLLSVFTDRTWLFIIPYLLNSVVISGLLLRKIYRASKIADIYYRSLLRA